MPSSVLGQSHSCLSRAWPRHSNHVWKDVFNYWRGTHCPSSHCISPWMERSTGSILQAWSTQRTWAWRTELLFDKVCMRRSRGLYEHMNSIKAEYKRKEHMAKLNCFPSTEQKAEYCQCPANLCVTWQGALMMMAVKTNQTEEQLKSILQVFRLYLKHKEALRKPLGKFYC